MGQSKDLPGPFSWKKMRRIVLIDYILSYNSSGFQSLENYMESTVGGVMNPGLTRLKHQDVLNSRDYDTICYHHLVSLFLLNLVAGLMLAGSEINFSRKSRFLQAIPLVTQNIWE